MKNKKKLVFGLLGGLSVSGREEKGFGSKSFGTSGSCIICEICVICGKKIIRRLRRLAQINEEQEKNCFYAFLGGREEKGFGLKSLVYKRFVYNL